MTVVGVVGDVRQYGLDAPATAGLYVPEWLNPLSAGTLVVRTSSDPAALVPALRRELAGASSELAVYDVQTMEGRLAATILLRRFSMLLLGVFAALALLLASVGIYGVISYAVAQRRHEIGIRMALGASPGDVLRMVVRQGMALALAGVAVGLVASLALTRLLAGLLYGVSARDPLTFGTVAALLAAVALLACLVPARRATKVDPTTALRYE
jgi:putative ABC transport system permease protein